MKPLIAGVVKAFDRVNFNSHSLHFGTHWKYHGHHHPEEPRDEDNFPPGISYLILDIYPTTEFLVSQQLYIPLHLFSFLFISSFLSVHVACRIVDCGGLRGAGMAWEPPNQTKIENPYQTKPNRFQPNQNKFTKPNQIKPKP